MGWSELLLTGWWKTRGGGKQEIEESRYCRNHAERSWEKIGAN